MPKIPKKTLRVLEAYSRGELTWRKAATALMLDNYDDLKALMKQANLPFWQPDPKQQQEAIADIQKMLIDELSKGLKRPKKKQNE